jgi:hypothetical protein
MPFVEQRQAVRTDIDTPVAIWLPAARRSYHGCCVNVSRRGALIRLPLSAPVRTGQRLKLQFSSLDNAAPPDSLLPRELRGCVLRVDRESSLRQAELLTALVFDDRSPK